MLESQLIVFAPVFVESGMNECTLRELETAISPSLGINDKHTLLNTLLEFPDVFNDGLGHTTVRLNLYDEPVMGRTYYFE